MSTVTDILDLAASDDEGDGELTVVIGKGCRIGTGGRYAVSLRHPETGELFLAAHLPCGCGCSECYGIIHQFRVDDDGTDASLVGMGIHRDVRLPVKPMGLGLLITDGSGIDIIDERESDPSYPGPTNEDPDMADKMTLYCMPEYEKFEQANPTEAPDEDDEFAFLDEHDE